MRENDIAGRAIAIIAPKTTPKPKPKPRPAQQVRRADVVGIVEADHEKYRIKAGQLGGVFVARAFPKTATRAQGLIAEAEGDTEELAIAALRAKIEARDVQRKAVRRWDDTASVSVPNSEEFYEALRQIPLSRPQIAMLKALGFARDQGLTMAQLARAAAYKSRDTATKVFRKSGDLIADYLTIDLGEHDARDGDGAALLLAVKNIQGDDVPPVWVMHPELREAVQRAL